MADGNERGDAMGYFEPKTIFSYSPPCHSYSQLLIWYRLDERLPELFSDVLGVVVEQGRKRIEFVSLRKENYDPNQGHWMYGDCNTLELDQVLAWARIGIPPFLE